MGNALRKSGLPLNTAKAPTIVGMKTSKPDGEVLAGTPAVSLTSRPGRRTWCREAVRFELRARDLSGSETSKPLGIHCGCPGEGLPARRVFTLHHRGSTG